MTQEDITRMAREAGWLHEYDSTTGFVADAAFKFAALVAEHEREECAKPWVKTYAGGKPNYTEPQQEPVAGEQFHEHLAGPFYAAPRPWVGLTDEEYQTILGQLGDAGLLAFYTLIETKLKERNT
jgi:hypothetical protein